MHFAEDWTIPHSDGHKIEKDGEIQEYEYDSESYPLGYTANAKRTIIWTFQGVLPDSDIHLSSNGNYIHEPIDFAKQDAIRKEIWKQTVILPVTKPIAAPITNAPDWQGANLSWSLDRHFSDDEQTVILPVTKPIAAPLRTRQIGRARNLSWSFDRHFSDDERLGSEPHDRVMPRNPLTGNYQLKISACDSATSQALRLYTVQSFLMEPDGNCCARFESKVVWDSMGQCLYSNMPEGWYRVLLEAPGHEPASHILRLPESDSLTAALQPLCTFKGRVVDASTGEGIPNVEVYVFSPNRITAEDDQTYVEQRTNANGEFIILAPPAHYKVGFRDDWFGSYLVPSKFKNITLVAGKPCDVVVQALEPVKR